MNKLESILMNKLENNEKSIETELLTIKGNIMSWEGMMIQLSNVSCISTSDISLLPFPLASLFFVFAGIFLLRISVVWSLIFVFVGAVLIYQWYQENRKRKLRTNLNIIMNSGNNLSFVVGNKKFLKEMLIVLKKIIINGGVGNQSVLIDIKGCNISDNAHFLDNLNINIE